jgi:hypothetical protein|eukprot:COSAG06_NODE_2433_length_6885_cov_2.054966_4_plen_84_part_00
MNDCVLLSRLANTVLWPACERASAGRNGVISRVSSGMRQQLQTGRPETYDVDDILVLGEAPDIVLHGARQTKGVPASHSGRAR